MQYWSYRAMRMKLVAMKVDLRCETWATTGEGRGSKCGRDQVVECQTSGRGLPVTGPNGGHRSLVGLLLRNPGLILTWQGVGFLLDVDHLGRCQVPVGSLSVSGHCWTSNAPCPMSASGSCWILDIARDAGSCWVLDILPDAGSCWISRVR